MIVLGLAQIFDFLAKGKQDLGGGFKDFWNLNLIHWANDPIRSNLMYIFFRWVVQPPPKWDMFEGMNIYNYLISLTIEK